MASIRSPSTPMSSQKRMTLQDLFDHQRIVVIQVRLVREETMPVISLGYRIPGPVGFFRVGENDARFFIFLVGVAPHVIIPLRRTWRRQPRPLKPGMLIGGMVDHQLDHDLQAAVMRGIQKVLKILQRSIAGMNASCSRKYRSHRRAGAKGKTAAARCR